MRPGGGDANGRYCPSSKMDSAPETRPKMTTDLCFRNATELAAVHPHDLRLTDSQVQLAGPEQIDH